MVATVALGDGDLSPSATVERNVMVPMRDGVRIACDVYRPVAEGHYPVLYAVSPYIKDSVDLPTMSVYRYRETGNIARLVDRGYVYVHADARGAGPPDGDHQHFSADERPDQYALLGVCAAPP